MMNIAQIAQVSSTTTPWAQYGIRNDDLLITLSLEKYMEMRGYTPNTVRPEEWVRLYESISDNFYSDIIQRLNRVIPYINYMSQIDPKEDTSYGMKISLYHHFRNSRFMTILMSYLSKVNDNELSASVGAMLCDAAAYYVTEMKKLDEEDAEAAKKDKKDKKDAEPKKSHLDDNVVASMYTAAQRLLAGPYSYVKNNYPGLTDGEQLMIAAYLVMNNEVAVKNLIACDLPLTADLFEKYTPIKNYPGPIIAAILNLEKADYSKLSVNQEKFVNTLEKWVFSRLDALVPSDCFDYLTRVYGTYQPADKIKTKLIQIQDCGTQYPQLFTVAKAFKLK